MNAAAHSASRRSDSRSPCELLEALQRYESETEGFGRRFALQVEEALHRMRDSTLQVPIIHENIHRALLRHFPYALMLIVSRTRVCQ